MATQHSAGDIHATSSHSFEILALSWNRTGVTPRDKRSALAWVALALATSATLLFQTAPAHAQSAAQSTCVVQETGLRDAINSYANACSLPRVDCDRFGGEWVCASFTMATGQARPAVTVGSSGSSPSAGNNSGNSPSEPSPAPTTPTPTVIPTPAPSSAARCEFTASSLTAARNGYANQCSLPRVDCDPSGGQWTCASYRLGAAGPGNSSNANPVVSGGTGIVYGGDYGPPQRGWMDSYSANGRCYIASGFDHGIGDVQVDTPAGKRTVRQVAAALGNGPGVGNNPIYNDVQCGNGPANNAGDEDINQCPGRVDLGTPGCSMRGPTWDLSVFEPQTPTVTRAPTPEPVVTSSSNNNSSPVSGPVNAKSALPGDSRYQPGDLIGMHYDNSGDRDDGHATAAAKMVVSYYGLGRALHILNGTYDARYPNGYNGDSEIVMNTTWGSEGRNSTWWNADARPDRVRNETVARWRQTLEAGHKVWLAEGGPSDFTAGILRQLDATTNLNLKNIHIIQHSVWNEDHTSDANIRDVKRLATYRRIGDGNLGGNNTPDLNQASDSVARRFLSDSEFAPVWRAAFNYLPVFNCSRSGPHCKFDGSDAVALMWIVGVESDEIRNWSDFASRYAN